MISPSPLDLASLYGCKQWLSISGNGSDDNLQACLTAASIYFLRYTGRGPRNWQNTTQNPFNEPVAYSEVYDGISGDKLFLRNFPINSVSSLTVQTYAVPSSSGPGMPGYTVDDQGRAVVIRAGGGGASPQTFQYIAQFGAGYSAGYNGGAYMRPFGAGPQGIQVSYIAGFNTNVVVGELHTVVPAWQASTAYATNSIVSDGIFLQRATNSGTSGTVAPPWSYLDGGTTPDNTITWVNEGETAAPNTVQIQNDSATLSDQGVSYFSSGNPLTNVLTSPTVGQYYLVSPGNYLFNAADAGQQMAISYTSAGTPGDIILAIFQLVGLNYKRRDWIGLRSVAMKDVGSTSYTMQMDQSIKDVLEFYKRNSLSS